MSLSYDLRQIEIKNVSKCVGLTPNVNEFYKKIVNYGQQELSWAIIIWGDILKKFKVTPFPDLH